MVTRPGAKYIHKKKLNFLTEEFVPGFLLLPLSRDKVAPGQRDKGTSLGKANLNLMHKVRRKHCQGIVRRGLSKFLQ